MTMMSETEELGLPSWRAYKDDETEAATMIYCKDKDTAKRMAAIIYGKKAKLEPYS